MLDLALLHAGYSYGLPHGCPDLNKSWL